MNSPQCCVEKADSAGGDLPYCSPLLHSLVPLPRSPFSQVLNHFYLHCQTKAHLSPRRNHSPLCCLPQPACSLHASAGAHPRYSSPAPLQGAGQPCSCRLFPLPLIWFLQSHTVLIPRSQLRLCLCLTCWATSSLTPLLLPIHKWG